MVPIYGKIKQYMQTNRIRTAEMFRLFDKDGSGSISHSELHSAITTTLGMDLDKDQVARIIRDIDQDGDTEVSYKEFCEKLNGSHFAPISLSKRQRKSFSKSFSSFPKDRDSTVCRSPPTHTAAFFVCARSLHSLLLFAILRACRMSTATAEFPLRMYAHMRRLSQAFMMNLPIALLTITPDTGAWH